MQEQLLLLFCSTLSLALHTQFKNTLSRERERERERGRDRDGNRRRAGSSRTLQGTRCYVASLLRSCGLLCDLKVGSQCRCQPSCLLPLQGRNCCLHSGALGFLHRDVSKCRGGEGSIKYFIIFDWQSCST